MPWTDGLSIWECFRPVPPSIPPDPRLANVLKQVRLERERTQEAAAYEADLVTTTVARVERCQINPAWTTVCAIAEALDLPLAELGRLVEAEGERP
jgi:DNA-binding XRE family transcriptional regulator